MDTKTKILGWVFLITLVGSGYMIYQRTIVDHDFYIIESEAVASEDLVEVELD